MAVPDQARTTTRIRQGRTVGGQQNTNDLRKLSPSDDLPHGASMEEKLSSASHHVGGLPWLTSVRLSPSRHRRPRA